MGFMGLGMQKWIYKQKPRKPFSKNRKSSFSSVTTHRQQDFVPHKKKKNKWYRINIALLLILILMVGVSIPFIKTWDNYVKTELQEERTKKEQEPKIIERNEVNVYRYPIWSAEVQLDYKNYDLLFNETVFLITRYPNSKKAKQLHLIALYNQCTKN